MHLRIKDSDQTRIQIALNSAVKLDFESLRGFRLVKFTTLNRDPAKMDDTLQQRKLRSFHTLNVSSHLVFKA